MCSRLGPGPLADSSQTPTRRRTRSVLLITRPRRTDSSVSSKNTHGRPRISSPPRREQKQRLSRQNKHELLLWERQTRPRTGFWPKRFARRPPRAGAGGAGRAGRGCRAPRARGRPGASSSRSPPSFFLAESPRSRQPKALNLNGSRSANSADSRAPGLGGGERASERASQPAGEGGGREARRGQGRGGRRSAARGARGGDGDGGGPLGACTMELALSPPPPASRPRRAGSRFHVTCTKRNGFWGRPRAPLPGAERRGGAGPPLRRPAPGRPAASRLPPSPPPPPRQVGDRRERTWAAAAAPASRR